MRSFVPVLLTLRIWYSVSAPLPGGVPEQRHLALGVAADVDASKGAALTWVTSLDSGRSATVRVSSTSAAEVLNGGGSVYSGVTYNYSYVDERYGNFYQSGDIHRVFLDSLQPRTTYWYAVDGAEEDVRAFKTVPSAGDSESFNTNAQLEVSIMGDLGQTDNSRQTVARACPSCASVGSDAIGRDEAAFALIVGDLSYSDGDPEKWDVWGRVVEVLASRMALMFMPGNHEIELNNDTMEPFTNYRNRYVMSQQVPELLTPGQVHSWHSYNFSFTYEGGSSYYSFDIGRAHFVLLNTYVDTTVGSVQYNWLENDLATLDRSKTPWVFAFFHGPWYNSNQRHQNEVATDNSRAAMEPLMQKYEVSMVFAGHVHSYERSHPVYMNNVQSPGEAPVYVVVGDGGNHEGLYNGFSPQPWTAYYNGSSYGHGRLKIYNDSVATWEWFPNLKTTAEDSVVVLNLFAAPDGSDDGDDGGSGVQQNIVTGAVVAVVVAVIVVAAAVVLYRRRKAAVPVENEGLVSSAAKDDKAFEMTQENASIVGADDDDDVP